MKKLFLLLLLTVGFVSCEKGNDLEPVALAAASVGLTEAEIQEGIDGFTSQDGTTGKTLKFDDTQCLDAAAWKNVLDDNENIISRGGGSYSYYVYYGATKAWAAYVVHSRGKIYYNRTWQDADFTIEDLKGLIANELVERNEEECGKVAAPAVTFSVLGTDYEVLSYSLADAGEDKATIEIDLGDVIPAGLEGVINEWWLMTVATSGDTIELVGEITCDESLITITVPYQDSYELENAVSIGLTSSIDETINDFLNGLGITGKSADLNFIGDTCGYDEAGLKNMLRAFNNTATNAIPGTEVDLSYNYWNTATDKFHIGIVGYGEAYFIVDRDADGNFKVAHGHVYDNDVDGYSDALDQVIVLLQDDCPDEPVDPADTLSEWSAWTEISRSGGDSTTVNDGAAVVTTATAGSDVEFVTETTTQNTLINTTAVIAVEGRTRTVVINGDEDAIPPTGTLSETRDTEVSAATSVAGEPVVTTREVENDAYEEPATLTLLGVTATNVSNSASVSIAGDIESLVSPGATVSINGVQYSVVRAQHVSGYTTIRIDGSITSITAAAGSEVYLVE